jgi:hypothetical protein
MESNDGSIGYVCRTEIMLRVGYFGLAWAEQLTLTTNLVV